VLCTLTDAIDALFDSGAENFVIRSDVVKHLQYSVLGSVTLNVFDDLKR